MSKIRRRWQEIKFDRDGCAFVKHHGMKFLMGDFMRHNHETVEGFTAHGYHDHWLIEVSDCGDCARVW